MKELFTIIVNLIWRPIRNAWSNFYWNHIKHATTDYPIADEDLRRGDESPKQYICRIDNTVMDAFEYKHDGPEELGDSTPPPAEMYKQVKEDGCFMDDCDGYHSCMYHLAIKNGIDCHLLSVLSAATKWGHAVLCYKDGSGRYHIHDYLTDFQGDDLDALIITLYGDVCGHAMMVFESTYDYDAKKWRNVNRSNHILRG